MASNPEWEYQYRWPDLVAKGIHNSVSELEQRDQALEAKLRDACPETTPAEPLPELIRIGDEGYEQPFDASEYLWPEDGNIVSFTLFAASGGPFTIEFEFFVDSISVLATGPITEGSFVPSVLVPFPYFVSAGQTLRVEATVLAGVPIFGANVHIATDGTAPAVDIGWDA